MPFKKGFIPWNKGKPMSEISKKKVSDNRKGKPAWNKGKPSTWTSKRNKIDNRLRRKEQHWNWKGGISKIDKIIREMPEYKQWRSDVFQRDNWTCKTCATNIIYVTAHHIKSLAKIVKDYNIKNTEDARNCNELWELSNGITLCEYCHSLTDNYKGKNKGFK